MSRPTTTPRVATVTVECNRPVADEMCRYDNGTIISQEAVSCPAWARGDAELESAYTVYRFVIQSRYVSVRRWLSFGIVITKEN